MSLIVAARFETFDEAKNAAAALMSTGVHSDDMHTFFVNPAGAHSRFPIGGDQVADPDAKGAPAGAVGLGVVLAVVGAAIGALIGSRFGNSLLPVAGGAGVGAYLGSLVGGLARLGGKKPPRSPADQHDVQDHGGRRSGVLLAVRVEAGHEQDIAATLRQHGGVEVERARGRWRDGQWEDFDPIATPQRQADASPSGPAAP